MGRTARQDSAKLPRSEFLNEQGLIFGATYESAAVIPDGSWLAAYEVGPDGAVLARPDGYVAWRARTLSGDPAGALSEVLDSLLRR
jgi:hypothetical protein